MRTHADQLDFSNWLQQLGNGQLELFDDIGGDAIKLPTERII
jgi:hypothetical protein